MTRRSQNRRRGISAVEAAIVMPALLILCLGSLEVGRMINVQILLKNAAREAASQASAGTMTNSEVEQVGVQYLSQGGLKTTNAKVTVSNESFPGVDAANAKVPDRLKVTISLPLKDVTWLPFQFLMRSTTELNATCTWTSRKST